MSSYAEILKDLPKSCLAVAEKRCSKRDYDIKVADDPLITEIFTKVRDTYLEKRDRAKLHARAKRVANAAPVEIVENIFAVV